MVVRKLLRLYDLASTRCGLLGSPETSLPLTRRYGWSFTVTKLSPGSTAVAVMTAQGLCMPRRTLFRGQGRWTTNRRSRSDLPTIERSTTGDFSLSRRAGAANALHSTGTGRGFGAGRSSGPPPARPPGLKQGKIQGRSDAGASGANSPCRASAASSAGRNACRG